MFVMHGRLFAEARTTVEDRSVGFGLKVSVKEDRGRIAVLDLWVFRLVVGVRPAAKDVEQQRETAS